LDRVVMVPSLFVEVTEFETPKAAVESAAA
jgi:hypothetical protein